MVDFKALVPWRTNKAPTQTERADYFDPFVTFRREMDRMFDDFFGGTSRPAPAGWQTLTPAIDIDETGKEIVITAELPGISDKDVEVSVAGDILTIRGEKRAEHEEKSGAPLTWSAASARSPVLCGCPSRSRTSEWMRSSRTAY